MTPQRRDDLVDVPLGVLRMTPEERDEVFTHFRAQHLGWHAAGRYFGWPDFLRAALLNHVRNHPVLAATPETIDEEPMTIAVKIPHQERTGFCENTNCASNGWPLKRKPVWLLDDRRLCTDCARKAVRAAEAVQA